MLTEGDIKMASTESNGNFEKYDLSLGGHALTISTDQDQKKMDLIAKIANEKIKSSLLRGHSFQKCLMIALLQVCEENIDLKSNVHKKVHGLEQKAEQVLKKFQEFISED